MLGSANSLSCRLMEAVRGVLQKILLASRTTRSMSTTEEEEEDEQITLESFLNVFPKRDLKGLRHEDFAVLGQFCAKIITYCLYPNTKCSCETIRKISNEFYQGELTIIIILVIFEHQNLKKLAQSSLQIFQVSIHFYPCHP